MQVRLQTKKPLPELKLEHVGDIAEEFARSQDIPYSQPGVLATNASKTFSGEICLNHGGYIL
jgi:hypothetical protein